MKLKLLLVLFTLLLPLMTIAQIEFSLELATDGETYIVYAKPLVNTTISTNTIVASGQITIITPAGFQLKSITNLGSQWDMNPIIIRAPLEDPTHDYFSFALIGDRSPKAVFEPDVATALLSFQNQQGCQGVVRLIDNENDAFAILPNSIGSNPGNELRVLDLNNNLLAHNYIRNGATDLADCSNNNPTIDILTTKSAAIRWETKNNVIGYEVQVRLSNTTEWLTTLCTEQPKIFLSVPEVQVYEYQIKTKLADGTSELSDILAIDLIGNN